MLQTIFYRKRIKMLKIYKKNSGQNNILWTKRGVGGAHKNTLE